MGRKARKSTIIEKVAHVAPPARKRRRGRKLVLLLALAGIVALVRKNLSPSAAPASYEPPAPRPPAPPVAEQPAAPAPVVEEPVVEEPVAEEAVVEEPAADEPAPEEPVVEPEPEAVAEPTDELDQAPAEAESLTSFFDQVMNETEAAKKPKPPKKRS